MSSLIKLSICSSFIIWHAVPTAPPLPHRLSGGRTRTCSGFDVCGRTRGQQLTKPLPNAKAGASGSPGEPARAKMAGGAPRPPQTSSKLSFLFAFQRSLVQTLQTAMSHQEFKRITLVCRVRIDEILTEHAIKSI